MVASISTLTLSLLKVFRYGRFHRFSVRWSQFSRPKAFTIALPMRWRMVAGWTTMFWYLTPTIGFCSPVSRFWSLIISIWYVPLNQNPTQEMFSNYSPSVYTANGPQLITRVFNSLTGDNIFLWCLIFWQDFPKFVFAFFPPENQQFLGRRVNSASWL